jgi:hypothetical protein
MQKLPKAVVIPTISGVASFFLGVGVGYGVFWIKRKIAIKRAIAQYEEFREQVKKQDENQPELPFDEPVQREEPKTVLTFVPLSEIVEEVVEEVVLEEEPMMIVRDDDPGDYIVNPLRGVEDDDWCYEVEAQNRSDKRPYVIHYNEFMANELDYPQSSITYYAGDDVLCDELDVPIYGRDKIVGLLLFGHGSQDPNVVYVRNEKIEAEYEILRDPGHFGVTVLGMEEEIQHSKKKKKDKEPIPKFRLE